MASISSQKLVIVHDHVKKTARCHVTAKIKFDAFEMNQMAAGAKCKVKCQLWGADSGLTGSDDYLYTYGNVYFFADTSPSATENVDFDIVLGEGVLNEDDATGGFVDEVYGKILLSSVHLPSANKAANTNTISHNF